MFSALANVYGKNSTRQHNGELHDLYSSPDITRVIKSRRMWWAGHIARMGERWGTRKIFGGKPEWKRPLGRRRHRWKDNITMDLTEMGWEFLELMHLTRYRDQWRTLVSTERGGGVSRVAGW